MVLEFADVGITYIIFNSDDEMTFILYSRHLLSRHSPGPYCFAQLCSSQCFVNQIFIYHFSQNP